MSLLFVHTIPFTTYTLRTSTMSEATFNFRLQTLLDEIEMHDHKDELIALLQEQVSDDTFISKY